MRSRLDEELLALNRQLIEMGAFCEEAIALAIRSLLQSDTALAGQVAPVDAKIDRSEREIESLCLRILLEQQPVAGDLRKVSAALKMITDMERIGDQASDIAEIVTVLGVRTGSECAGIREMALEAVGMVTDSVDAFVRRDTAIAEKVMKNDDRVDALFVQVKDALTGMIADDPTCGGYVLDLLMIAKYLERIADHTTNIAEWVVFAVTGVHNGEFEP